MTQDPEIATLRRQLSSHHDRRGKRSYPDATKRAATQLARSRQRDGHSIASTARALGIHPVVLGSWLRRDSRSAHDAFAPVVLSDAPTVRSTTAIVVTHSPSGLHIEGLSIAQLTELLRGLR